MGEFASRGGIQVSVEASHTAKPKAAARKTSRQMKSSGSVVVIGERWNGFGDGAV